MGLEQAFKEREIPLHINILGPSMKLFLTDLEPNFETYCGLDMTLLDLLYLSLMPEGIFLTNPMLKSIYLSFAHTEEDVAKIIEAVNSSLDKYRINEAF
jgi:glutamate-1-semialdehyde aminotransferase